MSFDESTSASSSSGRSVLQQMEDAAIAVLHTILTTSIGAIAPSSSSFASSSTALSTSPSTIHDVTNTTRTQSLSHRRMLLAKDFYLQQQQQSISQDMDSSEDGVSMDASVTMSQRDRELLAALPHQAEDELLDNIDRLNAETRELFYQRARELALVNAVHDSALFADVAWERDSHGITTREKKHVRALLERRDTLSQAALNLSKEVGALDRKCNQVRRELARLQEDNRRKYDRIQELEEELQSYNDKVPSKKLQAMRKALKNQNIKSIIIRNILQLLIVASGVDWAGDDELRETMLSLHNPTFTATA